MAAAPGLGPGRGYWHVSALRCRNFKSWGSAWTQIELPSPQLVGIVGPNGSGKSNLLEALMFAAGAPSTDMRVKSLRELCNSASPDQLCEVEFQVTYHDPGALKHPTCLVGGAPFRRPSSAKAASSAGSRSGLSDSHWVRAALTPDGSRAFQIDGKQKSAAQVKEFLRAHGLHLDQPTAVIRQAAVTHLADCNDPAAVGAVVAGASGLARWEVETARAVAEVRAARTALGQIQADVSLLRQLVAQDDAKAVQEAQARELEGQIAATAQGLAGAYARQQAARMGGAAQTRAEIRELQDKAERLQQQLEQALQEHEAAAGNACGGAEAGAAGAAAPGGFGGPVTKKPLLGLIKAVAGLNAEVGAAAKRLEQAKARAQEHMLCWRRLQQAQQLSADQQLALEEALSRVHALEQAAEEEDAAAAYGAHLRGQLEASSSAVAGLRAALEQARVHAQGLEGRVAEAVAEAERLEKAAGRLSSEAHDAGSRATALEASMRTLRSQLQAARSIHSKAQVKAAVLGRSMGGPAPGVAPALPSKLLHLFFFKPPAVYQHQQQAQAPHQHQQGNQHYPGPQLPQQQHQQPSPDVRGLCKALSVVAGRQLDVLVVGSSADVARVLSSKDTHGGSGVHGGPRGQTLRIWPLDRITCADCTRVQRAAQQALGPGRVLLPLDLLDFKEAHRPALLRAFGGSVLAVDNATAAELAQRYGLSSVTPDGTVSRPGTVTGGYMGPASAGGPEALLLQKHDLAQARAEEAELSAQVTSLEAQLLAAEAEHASAQLAAQQAAQAQDEAAAAAQAAEAARVAVQGAASREAVLQQQLEQAEARVARYTQLLQQADAAEGLGRGMSTGAAAGEGSSRLAELRAKDLEAATKELGKLQAKQVQLLAEEQKLEDKLQALELQICAGAEADQEGQCQGVDQGEPGQAEGHEQAAQLAAAQVSVLSDALAAARSRLVDMQARLADARAEEQEAQRRAQEASQQAAALAARVEALKREQAQVRSHLQTQRDALAAQQQQLAEIHAMAQALKREFPGAAQAAAAAAAAVAQAAAAADTPAAAEAGAGPGSGPGDQQLQGEQVKKLQGSLRRLQEERSALDMSKGAGDPASAPVRATSVLQAGERRAALATFTQRAAALGKGADLLESGIAASRACVLGAHRAVVARVCDRFGAMCDLLLPPGLRVALHEAAQEGEGGSSVEGGRAAHASTGAGAASAAAAPPRLILRFKRSKAGEGLEEAPWLESLEQLSGGQRTLVSLALLLAAACEGCRSSVVLMDEVDAALDEHNQAAVAALLSALAHGLLSSPGPAAHAGSGGGSGAAGRAAGNGSSTGSGMQVICVSHHAAFQKSCDALVQVSRTAAGTEAAVAGQGGRTAGGPAGQAVSSQGPVGGISAAVTATARGAGGGDAWGRGKRVRAG